jgi:hypothetical protein
MSDSKDPPRLPDVVDEAGPSPRWLPWLGIGLFGLLVLAVAALRSVGDRADAGQPSEVVADEAAAGGGAEPEAKTAAAAER